jgi:hypothetical protein
VLLGWDQLVSFTAWTFRYFSCFLFISFVQVHFPAVCWNDDAGWCITELSTTAALSLETDVSLVLHEVYLHYLRKIQMFLHVDEISRRR